MSRPRDIEAFLSSYPSLRPNPNSSANLQFYRNKRKLQPDNVTYDQFMRAYERDYVELEMNHGYVQWLFPIREHGVNPQAQPLEPHEIAQMKDDPVILSRLLRSYKMMLGFYGIDFHAGVLRPSKDYKERLQNLRDHSHNLLRLTRILKHLSEFPELQPHAAALVLYFVAAHSEGLIDFSRGTMRGDSMDRWWSECFRNEREREEVRSLATERGGYKEGKWGWKEYEGWYEKSGLKGFVG